MESIGTLYERLGGEAALALAVDGLYKRLMRDPELSPFFNGIDMARLRAHQHAFLSQLTGGPRKYSSAGLQRAHANLKIGTRHFNAVASHLVDTLQTLGVEKPLINEVVSALTPLADQIVPNRSVAAQASAPN